MSQYVRQNFEQNLFKFGYKMNISLVFKTLHEYMWTHFYAITKDNSVLQEAPLWFSWWGLKC